MRRTSSQKLADHLLGQPVETWIAARRPGSTWLALAIELRKVTDGKVAVTTETLRTWGSDAERVGGAA